jgi:hypothetical protein
MPSAPRTDWWDQLEGRSTGRPDSRDAEHWIDVYEQLIATLRAIRDEMDGNPEAQALVHRRLRDCELRRAHWLGVLQPH